MKGIRFMMNKLMITAAVALMLGASFFVSQATAGKKADKAEIGKAAPLFELSDQNGKTVTLSQFKGKKHVVLEWYCPTCPAVKAHYSPKTQTMNKLAKKYAGKDVVWLTINSTKGSDNASNLKAAKAMDIERPLLNDAAGKVGKLYGARTTPHMFVITKDGKLAYDGAIDNKRSGKDGVNYVDQALSEIIAGKAVSVSKTKSYGCGVKYAKN